MVLVYVPRAQATEEVTRLVKVSAPSTYRDTATGQATRAAQCGDPEAAGASAHADTVHGSMEVEREHVQLSVAEGIAAARVAADGGQHASATEILNTRLKGGGAVSAGGGRGRPSVQGDQGGAAQL
jgi:hypothetical protein